MKATAAASPLSTLEPPSAFQQLRDGVLGLLPKKRVEELARETGFVQRAPKQLPPFELLVCTMLSTVVEGRRGYAGIWRLLLSAAGIEVARSAVFQRMGKASAAFFEQVFHEVVARLPGPSTPELLGKLDAFSRVLADDGSVLSLSPVLAKLFPATRTNHTAAAAKLHATADIVHRRIVRVEITGERESERAVARKSPYEAGVLYLRDLGYTDYGDFRDTVKAGADFLSRLKTSANPTVVKVRHGVRAPKRAVGKKLSEVALTKCHDTFDLDARFTVRGGGSVVLRVIGRKDPETGEVHRYVTSLSEDRFSVEELASLYCLRWVIELLFKVLKSSCHLGHLDTTDPGALRTFIYASLIMATILSALAATAAEAAGVHPSEISILTLGHAAPLLALPLLLLWLHRKLTYDELAAMILRTIAIGCRDQNPARTRRKWGALN